MGDDLVRWLPVAGYEGMYEVSSDGQVRSLDRTKITKTGKECRVPGVTLSQGEDRDGYLLVNPSRDGVASIKKVHRLVAGAFIPNPDSLPDVNHKNGNKNDNRVENLEWSTRLHNMRHAYATGLIAPHVGLKGDEHGSSVLRDEDARCIMHLIAEGMLSYAKIGSLYGVCHATVSHIANGRSWQHIPRPDNKRFKPLKGCRK